MKITEVLETTDSYIDLLCENDYREFFKGKLKKWNVKSPFALQGEQRKAFFNELKKDWAAEKAKKQPQL